MNILIILIEINVTEMAIFYVPLSQGLKNVAYVGFQLYKWKYHQCITLMMMLGIEREVYTSMPPIHLM